MFVCVIHSVDLGRLPVQLSLSSCYVDICDSLFNSVYHRDYSVMKLSLIARLMTCQFEMEHSRQDVGLIVVVVVVVVVVILAM